MHSFKHTIMIVEEDSALRDSLREVLEAYYDITEAVNCRECLVKVKEEMPDLIILDIERPVNQWEVTMRNLRLLYPDIPVIVFSDLSDTNKVADLMVENGAANFISKPHKDLDSIYKKIAVTLSRYKSGQSSLS